MLRILFIILAIVSAVLALVLEQPLLYALAAVLVVVALLLVVATLRKRHQKAQEPYRRRSAPLPASGAKEKDDDLQSLGILEIKPRQPGAAREPAERGQTPPRAAERPPDRPAPGAADENGEAAEEEVSVGAPRLRPREKTRTANVAMDLAVEDHKEAVIQFLGALRAMMDAHTVCLLRTDASLLHYHIEAVVSLTAYARSGGDFHTKEPLVEDEAMRAFAVRRVGEHGLAPKVLGYYRTPLAIRQLASAPVRRTIEGDDTYLLLADSMKEGLLGEPRARTLLIRFARLLGVLLDLEAGGVGDASEEGGLRPRRDIIAEEMARARKAGRPLALALVYLNRAEDVADEGEDVLVEAEEAMEARLHSAVERGRVERFGELTYGIFYEGTLAEVESWAVHLQNEMADEEAPLAGGVSIGIALLKDRHDGPETFRADATDALREAFETGTCTILE